MVSHNFHEFVSHYDIERKHLNNMGYREYYGHLIKSFEKQHGTGCRDWFNMWCTCCMEPIWYYECRPYYKAFPSIVSSLQRFKLDVPGSALTIPHETVLSVRFLRGKEPIVCNRKICSLLGISIDFALYDKMNTSDHVIMYAVFWDNINPWKKRPAIGSLRLTNESVADSLKSDPIADLGTALEDRSVGLFCVQIVLSLFMLQNDPSIIQPDVLAKDRNRFDRSTDPEERQRLVDKAKRRGIVGWRLGEQYEVCPHFRRPHFGLRWTGEGKKIPRIVPIKGAVVHRQKIAEVPTGYILPDGREVE